MSARLKVSAIRRSDSEVDEIDFGFGAKPCRMTSLILMSLYGMSKQ